MKIITWNIQQGCGARVSEIIKTLSRVDPDVAILTEFKAKPNGEIIAKALGDMGMDCQAKAPSKGENSVFIASREEFEPRVFHKELGTHAHRCVGGKFKGFDLFEFYFPQKNEKFDVFQFIMKHLKDNLESPTLLIGDFNTGKHYQDEAKATFKCAELFESLERRGWKDLWRQVNGRQREYTWYSTAGNGFRIDHAFGSPSFAQNLTSARYDHEPREAKVSDHSLLCIEWSGVGDIGRNLR